MIPVAILVMASQLLCAAATAAEQATRASLPQLPSSWAPPAESFALNDATRLRTPLFDTQNVRAPIPLGANIDSIAQVGRGIGDKRQPWPEHPRATSSSAEQCAEPPVDWLTRELQTLSAWSESKSAAPLRGRTALTPYPCRK
jgi:hypothetical protein